MVTRLKRIVLTIAAALALAAPALVPVSAYALQQNLAGAASCGADLNLDTSGNQSCAQTNAGANFSNLITKIVNIFSVIVGVIAVIMIIVGGLKYITSGGESSNVSGAKNTIIYAIVGLIIVALAQFIVHFVLSSTAGI